VASRLELVSTGRRLVYNRFCDVILGVAAFVTSLDALSVDIGVALTSLLAVGGLGSVIVALACKEPLAHFISGLMVTFSDKFMV
jgi:small-conductance mechanosensitive channel